MAKEWTTKENIINLSKTIRPYLIEMLAAIISALFKQVTVIAAAGLTSYITGLALTGNPGNDNKRLIVLLCICILLRAVSYFGEMYFAHDVAFKVIRNYRLDLFDKICEISPAYTIRRRTGELGQAMVADVEILELFLAHTFSSFIVAFIVTAVIVVLLMFISPIIAVIMLVSAILQIYVPYAARKKSNAQGKMVRQALSDGNTVMVESVQGLREIVTLCGEEEFRNNIQGKMNDLYDAQYKYGLIKGREAMESHIVSGLLTAAVMGVSAMLVSQGSLSIEIYPVTVMLSTVVLGPVIELATVAQEMGIVFAASNRVQEMLDKEPVVKDEGTVEPESKPCKVEFENISFAYEDEEEDVLYKVSFSIEPEETVVMVGHTGAGKSTCANLLLRYWDADEGSIKINGIDIKDYQMESIRKMITSVPQETYLFHTTIRENIRVGRQDATDDDIYEASIYANADEFIKRLPKGYDTVTGERGFKLSGGQRQRIAIARTLLRNTPIVIFDEAVSNLDAENEKYIQEALKRQLADRTVLMIAHRLSTIVAADRIIMLENGRVIANGKHDELLHSSEAYRQLINNQLNS